MKGEALRSERKRVYKKEKQTKQLNVKTTIKKKNNEGPQGEAV